MDVVNTFLIGKGVDTSVFKDGISIETLRYFEETTKIGINIFFIDKRGQNLPDMIMYQYIIMKIMNEP
jgi:hypothetical protein